MHNIINNIKQKFTRKISPVDGNSVIYNYHPESYESYDESFVKWYTNKYGESGVAPFESQILPDTITCDLGSGKANYSLGSLKHNKLNKTMEDLMYDSYAAGSKTIMSQDSWDIIKKALRGENLTKDESFLAWNIAELIDSFESETERVSAHIYELS